jgi:hypothetical protein
VGRTLSLHLAMAGIGAASIGWLLLGLTKLFNLDEIASALSGHGLLYERWVASVAVLIGLTEVTLGVLGIAVLPLGPRLASGAAMLFSLVLAVFTIYASLLIVWPPDQPVGCGCFPGASPVSNWGTVGARTAAGSLLLLLAAFACRNGSDVPQSVSSEP